MLSKLDKRVTFQALNKVGNGRGGVTFDAANPIIIGTFWAKVEIKSIVNVSLYEGLRSESSTFITIRDNAAINESCQALYKGKLYQINDSKPDKKIGYTVLAASVAVK